MSVRLWHDDVRPAPPGWLWARTNDQAKDALRTGNVVECSLDHDLGLHDVEIPEDTESLLDIITMRGRGGETGYDLVNWMIVEDIFPPIITIHSWNPEGAMAMANRLARMAPVGTELTVKPYNPKEHGL